VDERKFISEKCIKYPLESFSSIEFQSSVIKKITEEIHAEGMFHSFISGVYL
jgi:hypothetical protein